MMKPQQLNLHDKKYWTEKDIEILGKIYTGVESKEDAIELWENNVIVRVGDTKDYEYVYEDFLQNTVGLIDMSFDEFMNEMRKGYGKSGCVEIGRLIELSNGVWYDNEYC